MFGTEAAWEYPCASVIMKNIVRTIIRRKYITMTVVAVVLIVGWLALRGGGTAAPADTAVVRGTIVQ